LVYLVLDGVGLVGVYLVSVGLVGSHLVVGVGLLVLKFLLGTAQYDANDRHEQQRDESNPNQPGDPWNKRSKFRQFDDAADGGKSEENLDDCDAGVHCVGSNSLVVVSVDPQAEDDLPQSSHVVGGDTQNGPVVNPRKEISIVLKEVPVANEQTCEQDCAEEFDDGADDGCFFHSRNGLDRCFRSLLSNRDILVLKLNRLLIDNLGVLLVHAWSLALEIRVLGHGVLVHPRCLALGHGVLLHAWSLSLRLLREKLRGVNWILDHRLVRLLSRIGLLLILDRHLGHCIGVVGLIACIQHRVSNLIL